MKVLLVEPGYNFPCGPWTPWGKLQLAAYIRKHGKYDVRVMDNAFWKGTDDGIRGTVGREVQPDIIGIGGMTLQLADTLRIARVIRAMYKGKKCPLMVAGGVHFTFAPQDAYELFDLVVIGEGEETFLNVCNRFKDTGSYSGEQYKDILGIGYKSNDGHSFTLTAPRPFMDASQICPPAFDLVPWQNRYDDGFITGEHVPMLMTGRGCPYDCEFCAAPQLYKRNVRLFDMEMVKDIMLRLKKIYNGIDAFRIMDDTFALNNKRVSEFCGMVSKDIGRSRFSCLTHCKTADLPTMKLMKDTGFWVVAYGFESGNDQVLKLINKKTTVQESANAIQIAHQAGLSVEGLFMLGCIGDTEATMLDTVNFASLYNHHSRYKTKLAWNWFQFATPFPGSRFFDEAEKYGTITTRDYGEYHHQKPVFIPKGVTEEMMVRIRAKGFKDSDGL